MGFQQAERMIGVRPSPIRKVLDRAKQMQRDGREIIHLEIGEPDFTTPFPIMEAAVRRMFAGETHYTANRGVPELLSAISRDLERRDEVRYSPAEEIIVTAGVAEALFDTIFAYVNPGDEVIGFSPAFINYAMDLSMAGAVYVPASLRMEDGFQPDCEALETLITNKTRMLILCNPCNPSGAVFGPEALKRIAEIAVRYDLLVISDQIYDRLVYDAERIGSIASLPGMRERTILLNGFSKAYAMTGWRLGYLAADRTLISPILRVHQYLTTCLPAFVQNAVAEKLEDPETERIVRERVAEFRARRDELVRLLQEVPGVCFSVPQGAFYLMLNVRGTGLDGETFAERLLEEQGIAVVPARAFGEAYGDYIRISYAASLDMIRRGVEGIAALARKLSEGTDTSTSCKDPDVLCRDN